MSSIFLIPVVAQITGENVELIEEVISNDDNLGWKEIVHIHDGSEHGVTGLTKDGIDSLQAFIADVRAWEGGIRQFLIDEKCDADMIERVMADETMRAAVKSKPTTP